MPRTRGLYLDDAVLVFIAWCVVGTVLAGAAYMTVGCWRAGQGADGGIIVAPLLWLLSMSALSPLAAAALDGLRDLEREELRPQGVRGDRWEHLPAGLRRVAAQLAVLRDSELGADETQRQLWDWLRQVDALPDHEHAYMAAVGATPRVLRQLVAESPAPRRWWHRRPGPGPLLAAAIQLEQALARRSHLPYR